ncbi:MAG: PorP/SprF family type IX secretion system membrane protein [Cyclobacteriaceae bacterium]
MKRLNLLTLVFISAIFFNVELRAQDPVFSQYYNAPVYLNPALIGDEESMLVNLNYRSQWQSLHEPYSTAQASFIYPFYRDINKGAAGQLGGMGLSVLNDVAGVNREFRTTGVSASFAYNLPLNMENFISFGLQAQLINFRIDPQGQEWGVDYVPGIGHSPGQSSEHQVSGNSTSLSITPGAFWRYFNDNSSGFIHTIYSGVAVNHLNNPDMSILDDQTDRLPLLYKYHGGIVFSVSQKVNLSANVLTLFQDTRNQSNVGAFVSYLLIDQSQGLFSNSIVRIGGWHRWNDSFILSTEFVTNKFQLGFSYDWNVTNLNRFQSGVGAYELSLGFRFNRVAPPKVRY